MAVINLRKYYYPFYTKDTFIEVPDDVAEVLEEGQLIENRQEHRNSYYHVYSMNCSLGIENHAMFLVLSPEELLVQELDEAAEELLLVHLAEAITPKAWSVGRSTVWNRSTTRSTAATAAYWVLPKKTGSHF